MNLLTCTPAYEEVYVVRGSEEESRIRASKPVVWSGVDEKGYYVGTCLDRSVLYCSVCIHGASKTGCEYSMALGTERK